MLLAALLDAGASRTRSPTPSRPCSVAASSARPRRCAGTVSERSRSRSPADLRRAAPSAGAAGGDRRAPLRTGFGRARPRSCTAVRRRGEGPWARGRGARARGARRGRHVARRRRDRRCARLPQGRAHRGLADPDATTLGRRISRVARAGHARAPVGLRAAALRRGSGAGRDGHADGRRDLLGARPTRPRDPRARAPPRRHGRGTRDPSSVANVVRLLLGTSRPRTAPAASSRSMPTSTTSVPSSCRTRSTRCSPRARSMHGRRPS